MDVYVISLSRAGLDDNSLQELISELPEKCIALMEDIDAAFHHTISRDLPDEGKGSEETKGPNPSSPATPERSSKISLSGLLNALDGVGAQEGRLLFATTNRYEALDAALRRPGRMDVHVEFKLASRYQVGELFRRFYLPTQRSSSKDTTTSKVTGGDHKTPDSGYNSPVEAETEKLIDVELLSEVQDQSLAAVSRRRRKHDTKISSEEVDILVERFRESIPDREFSMAELQGYLLLYKNQPRRAVECSARWAEEEIAKREARKASAKKDQ